MFTMFTKQLLLLAALSLSIYVTNAPLRAQTKGESIQFPGDEGNRLEVQLFAQDPQIVHPIGIDFDQAGRLLVIESHTHFPPSGYKGLKHDRIVAMEDTNSDGKADRFTTFFEGTIKTMDLAVHPDGSVYIAPRNEIIRLRDTDGDGKADEKTRIAFLETKGDYPHNGLCGLVFDPAGNLYFGFGENLGADYTLIGADGTKISDGAEGGNIFWCTAEGKNLRRVATGFWNPFGACLTSENRLFITDNDPDSSPPCRLIHVVDGGNYGYQFRYGRSGLHPFQSWNGQLPGTLPMTAGTGEGPCEVIQCNSKVWPKKYQGQLFVASWADHRIESYQLKPKGATYEAVRQTLLKGGNEFRPVGLVIGPDGWLYFSDWVLRDYKLHGKGRIWRARFKGAPNAGAVSSSIWKPNPESADPLAIQSAALVKDAQDGKRLITLLAHDDPFVATAARTKLAKSPGLLKQVDINSIKNPIGRIAVLQAHKQTREQGDDVPTKLISTFLNDPDQQVRFEAIKWIADQRLETFRAHVSKALLQPDLSPRMFMAYATAMARLDKRPAGDRKLVSFYLAKLKDAKTSPALKIMALRLIPPTQKGFQIEYLTRLLKQNDSMLRVEAVRSIAGHPDNKKKQVLLTVARDSKADAQARIWSLLGLADQVHSSPDLFLDIAEASQGDLTLESVRILARAKLQGAHGKRYAKLLSHRPQLNSVQSGRKGFKGAEARPDYKQTDAWLKLLSGKADVEAGRRIFFHPLLGGCYRCHRSEGRGASIGPDLSLIALRADRKAILESILQPGNQVAPRYVSWLIDTQDGQQRIGNLQRQNRNEQWYIGSDGLPFRVVRDQIITRTMSNTSLMPQNLVDTLSDQELRDLLAYLMRK